MKLEIGKTVLELVQGDITEMETEAIVNAANAQLQLGGGVAGAIRRRGGPAIQEECNKIGGTFVGGAVITTGGNLKAKYVIHAVGPMMGEGDEDNKLRNATLNSLTLADEKGIKSISFPAISTEAFDGRMCLVSGRSTPSASVLSPRQRPAFFQTVFTDPIRLASGSTASK